MKIKLNPRRRRQLEILYKGERDRVIADRIRVVLLMDAGWGVQKVLEAFRISADTVRRYLKEYREGKLFNDGGGSEEKLSEEQAKELEQHVEENGNKPCKAFCAYVEERYGVRYTPSGMKQWLARHGFVYKRFKGVPAKADAVKQSAFIEKYTDLKAKLPENEVILFVDAMHPTMATKIGRGWVRKGVDKAVLTTASRTRVNIMGAIEIATGRVVAQELERVNGSTTVSFLGHLEEMYPKASKIHVILDQSGYNTSTEVKELSGRPGSRINVHHLPPYSPNLNPIERLWKVMNEEVRNNVCFKTPREFRERIRDFFDTWVVQNINALKTRITDNFQLFF
jgi:transposase